MKEVGGNLIEMANEGKFDVIVHGCNCYCAMGAGIALGIKTHFPEAWIADQNTTPGDDDKLGQYTVAMIKRSGVFVGDYYFPKRGLSFVVVNAYTQYGYGRSVMGTAPVDYRAIKNVFKRIAMNFRGKKIGYPKIGAGLAGGDWEKISKIINKELEGEDHTLVNFTGV